ncbi:GNAT family N-acetyltransferase [Sulfoacidibacillus thermotolerans]|uniref:N-acetyltransferase domain-containing protein n=1 Tax=Sulfoacidibacillus thermotolerans TaxID=1765684 RepID=A0A2U3D674_SULT2|nr:GNAT family N-acetyltransferase [Sulfoacidibacillus thermotolerans]PWI56777.1 hypothetical protein BM613_11885 [Sulfoacidibacillus thermotolerans]
MTLFLNHALAKELEADLREGNQKVVDAWRTFPSEIIVETLRVEDALAIYTGPDSPINEVVGLGMTSPVSEDTLERIEQFYASYDQPTKIRVCPLADASLLTALSARGYRLTEFTYRWILDLATWQSPFFDVDDRVRGTDAFDEIIWSRTVAAGFLEMDVLPVDERIDLERAFFRIPSGFPVIAFDQGKAAAAGMMVISGSLATLFATSTIPSFRGRGLQSALLDWRLRYAKSQGARLATIETEPGSASQRNVERMGFHLAYVIAEMEHAVSPISK